MTNKEKHENNIYISKDIMPENLCDFIHFTDFANDNENGISVMGKVEVDVSMPGYIDREKLKDILLSQGKEIFGNDINFDIDEFVDNVIKEYWKDKNNDKK